MIGVGMANAIAFGGVTLMSLVEGRIAFALGAYAATILYMSVATLEISVAERRGADQGEAISPFGRLRATAPNPRSGS